MASIPRRDVRAILSHINANAQAEQGHRVGRVAKNLL